MAAMRWLRCGGSGRIVVTVVATVVASISVRLWMDVGRFVALCMRCNGYEIRSWIEQLCSLFLL